MPAVQTTTTPHLHDTAPAVGHINLMVDTFIANAHVDDLRAAVRSLLATAPRLASAFTAAARTRLRESQLRHNSSGLPLFVQQPSDGTFVSTAHLTDTLIRARALFGAGMGFASLALLTLVVKSSVGLRWEPESDLADTLALIDVDICQGIQSAKEELEAGLAVDGPSEREIIALLRLTVDNSFDDVQKWHGEFQFERTAATLKLWKF